MFKSFTKLFNQDKENKTSNSNDDKIMLFGGLLVEAALIDGIIDEKEIKKITKSIAYFFALKYETANIIVNECLKNSNEKLAIRNISKVKQKTKTVSYGDILLEKSGGSPNQPVGRVVFFDNENKFSYSNFIQKLSPADNGDSKYLFFKLFFEYENGLVLKYQQQTTGIINFQLAEYLQLKTAFPPLPEQQKIASILTSVDTVIEKTEAQINKLKDLKTAMMQELLTKGIGHTEFKDSPVGRIPVSWEVRRFGELTVSKELGTTVRGAGDNNYGLLKMGNMVSGDIDIEKLEKIKVTDENACLQLNYGDFLFSSEFFAKLYNSVILCNNSTIFRFSCFK